MGRRRDGTGHIAEPRREATAGLGAQTVTHCPVCLDPLTDDTKRCETCDRTKLDRVFDWYVYVDEPKRTIN